MKPYFFCAVLMLTGLTGCIFKKTSQPAITTTTVSGNVVGMYTGNAAEGVVVELYGVHRGTLLQKPPEPRRLIDTRTDNMGNYLLRYSTEDEPDSMFVTLQGDKGAMRKVDVGVSTTGISFIAPELIVLKQTYTVINNTKPPLRINGPFYLWKDVYAVDTVFTVFGLVSPNKGTCSSYGYFNESVHHWRDTCYSIGAYVDTMAMSFTVDASTF